MRRLAMAGDIPPLDAAQTLFGWLAGLATATVGAVGLWLAQRVLGKAAFQTAINDGFAKLTAELQEERDALRRTLDEERVKWAGERASLQGEIRNLNQTIESMKHMLNRQGMDLPEARGGREPDAGAVILSGPK